jgi:VIT1/CCC1 family predicted Fe2+/Mn2+ transporter
MIDRDTPHTPAEHRRTTARLEEERQRVERVSKIRQFVFGTLDGLLVPLGVVSGVAGGTGSTNAVIVAGIAEAFAGALSMGFGEFLAGRAEAQVQIAEIDKEKEGLKTDAEYEFHEMVVLLENEGVQPEDALVIAERLARNPTAFMKTMVEKELGFAVEPNTVRVIDGLIMGFSYMAASIVPLISYFFLPLQAAFVASLVLTYACLIIIGIVRGRLAKLNLLRSAIEVVAVGTISGLGGYFLGTWLPHLLGY